MEVPDWVEELFDTIDAMDADHFVDYMTNDASFKFGNAPAAIGRQAIRDGVAYFFSSIKALKHERVGAWMQGDVILYRGVSTYTRHDGSEITLPFLNYFGMEGNLIKEYQIYIDINPLYAPA